MITDGAFTLAALGGFMLSYLGRDFAYLWYSKQLKAVHFLGASAFFFAVAFDLFVLLTLPYVHGSASMCVFANVMCVTFYAFTKIWVYLYFIERARIATSMKTPRWQDLKYKKHLAMLFLPYGVMFVLMFWNMPAHYVEDLSLCKIGLERPASIPLVIYDTLFSVYLTWQFVVPVLRPRAAHKHEARLHAAAKRNLAGASVALASSLANMLSVATMEGMYAPVCLTCCLADAVACALAVWYTSVSAFMQRLRRQRPRPGTLSRGPPPPRVRQPYAVRPQQHRGSGASAASSEAEGGCGGSTDRQRLTMTLASAQPSPLATPTTVGGVEPIFGFEGWCYRTHSASLASTIASANI